MTPVIDPAEKTNWPEIAIEEVALHFGLEDAHLIEWVVHDWVKYLLQLNLAILNQTLVKDLEFLGCADPVIVYCEVVDSLYNFRLSSRFGEFLHSGIK